MQAIVRKSDNKIFNFNNAGHGNQYRGDDFKEIEIPDQDVDRFYSKLENGTETLQEIYYPNDIQTFTESELKEIKRKQCIKRKLDALEKATDTGQPAQKGLGQRKELEKEGKL